MIGGKAQALVAAEEKGLPVPPFFVVEATAPLDPASLVARAAALGPRVAVRSSALDEDGAEHSFAGQLESHLFVDAKDVVSKIEAVRRSGFSERLLAYRQERGLPPPTLPPAVVVQRMLGPECAGVAFAADPVTGERDVVVVSAVKGVGESLVSGEADADTWRVRGDSIDGPPAVLTHGQVREVAALARRASEIFGKPQDIEWAFEKGVLWLLQSRPITTLSGDGSITLWDNANIAESYTGVTTPLTFSFIRHVYAEVYREFTRLLNVPERDVEAHDPVFRQMLGLHEGRVYYNLVSWYRTLALLPGFGQNRAFMETMMGVREGLPPELLRDLEAKKGSRWRMAPVVGGLVKEHMALPRRIRAFEARLDSALALEGELSSLSTEELAAHYRALASKLLRKWDAPLANDLFCMIHYGLLRKLTTRWCDDADGTLQNDLLLAQGGMISTEPAKRMQAMAAIAREDKALARALREAPLAEGLATIERNKEFAILYHAYLEKFDDRCLDELKLESETLRDDPQRLHRSIGELAARPPPKEDVELLLRREADAEVAARLKGHPARSVAFRWVLRHARERVRDRENMRFERTRVFGRVRAIFVEIGKRLPLDDPRDVFYLELDEVLGFVDGTGAARDLRSLALARKTEFARYRGGPAPPDRFVTRGAVGLSKLEPIGAPPAAIAGEERQGSGCCPGVVRGRARVVLDPQNAKLEPGIILVAKRTDPGWILLFPFAKGLVVEHGSLLSHAAIVAREMGIPAVVACAGVTSWLKDGDEVEIDGRSGRVTRVG